jgi:HD-GYP domain-containing protein (c-di-GMP phosphodiesterase class II)/nucleotide-binding universal stress UspA family protein
MRDAYTRLRRALRLLAQHRINSRMLLLTFICGGELLCLLLALVGFDRWLSRDLLTEMRRQALETNEGFTEQLISHVRRLEPTDLRPGQPEWDRVLKIVERTKLPNDGFMCIIEGSQGRIICHPDFRSNPALLGVQLGSKSLHREDGLVSSILDAARLDSPATGWLEMPDGRHLVAVRRLPELNVLVLAHQREHTIVQIIADLKRGAQRAGISFALLATIGTAVLTILTIQRYEHRLADLNKGLELQVQRRTKALLRTRDAVIFGLAHLTESRHESTGEHLTRIGGYVECLARAMGRDYPALDEQMIHTIVVASSLHDIGKVAIPDAVLLKPGKLTPRQRLVMQRHTTVGGECLQTILGRLGEDDLLQVACQIAVSHHERWNGTGYPHGLKGEEIPLVARIVAVADVYDALTSERVYKCAMTHAQARQLIVRAAGKQFDPQIVEAFLRVEHEFARIAGRKTEPAAIKAAA